VDIVLKLVLPFSTVVPVISATECNISVSESLSMLL
jgi:hypothetical protein